MGKAPGSPRHTEQTLLFGGAPKPVGQPQKILVRVLSWTCTSRPITGSYLAIASAVASSVALEDMLHYRKHVIASATTVRRCQAARPSPSYPPRSKEQVQRYRIVDVNRGSLG